MSEHTSTHVNHHQGGAFTPIRGPAPPAPGHPLPNGNMRVSANIPVQPFMMNQATMPSIPSTQQAVPPFHTGPQFSRPKPRYEISDIRNEADAREQLSSYVVIRLEKADCSNEIDDTGSPMMPTWERVKQTVQTGMPKSEVAGRVKLLNKQGTSVLDKKATLPPAAQRQLEIAEEKLTTNDPDPRYQHALAQFEEELKLLDQQLIPASKGHKKEKKKGKHAKKRRVKSTYERVSITAYFKRLPKPSQNSKQMLEENERERQRVHQMARPPPPQKFPVQKPTAPVPSLPNGPPARGPPVQQRAPAAPPVRELPKIVTQAKDGENSNREERDESQSQSSEDKRTIPPPQNKERTESSIGERAQNIPIPPRSGKSSKVRFDSPRNSQSSFSSEASWSTDQSDVMTPQSSVGSDSHFSKPERGRTLYRPHQRPRADSSRQGSWERPYYIIETQTSRRTPSPSPRRHLPAQSVPRSSISPQTRQAGFPDHFEDAVQPTYQRKSTLPPRIIQAAHGVRRVSPPEARQQIINDSMERIGSRLERRRYQGDARREWKLHQGDDLRFDQLEEDIQQRRRLRARLRGLQQSEGYEPSERSARWSEDEAKKYMRDRASPTSRSCSPQ